MAKPRCNIWMADFRVHLAGYLCALRGDGVGSLYELKILGGFDLQEA